jgi:hypothetical protein
MKSIKDLTVELVSNGMIVRCPNPSGVTTECYVIQGDNPHRDDKNQSPQFVPLSHLWLIWFGSLPLLAVLIYLSVVVLGS